MKKDEVFAGDHPGLGSFKFDKKVAKVFDDMVSRSVPGYADHLLLQTRVAEKFMEPDSHILDIGCSTGNSLFPLFTNFHNAKYTGIDPSQDMLDRFREKLSFLGEKPDVDLIQGSVQDINLPSSQVVFFNYTLQFIQPEERQNILNSIFECLQPGGVLLFSEKMQNPGELIADLEVDFYFDYKRKNGYSELEISQKRDALEKVLVPDSLDTHLQRLKTAGFKEVGLWHKWFNFGSFVAIK